jgi:hypothetical protein
MIEDRWRITEQNGRGHTEQRDPAVEGFRHSRVERERLVDPSDRDDRRRRGKSATDSTRIEHGSDEAQLLNELKATGIRVGLLINLGRTKVEFKRFVF